jgi:hypothetical protein
MEASTHDSHLGDQRWLMLSAAALVVLFVLMLFFFDHWKGFYDKFGNLTSIYGLALAFVGFAITVHSVREAAEQIRSSKREIAAQIENDKADRNRMMAGFRLQWLQEACEAARLALTEAGMASDSKRWWLVADRFQSVREQLPRILVHEELTDADRDDLRRYMDNLKDLATRAGRLKDLEDHPVFARRFQDAKSQVLDVVVGIRTRLGHQTMEVQS